MNNTYKGYLNYATWLVASWIREDEELYNHFKKIITEIKEENSNRLRQLNELRTVIRDYVIDNKPEINGIYYELLNDMLTIQVNYFEIASKLLK